MKVIICYKWVVDEADVKVDPSVRSLIFRDAGHKISLYDKNAIEAGVQLIERAGGMCIALSAGTDAVKDSRKDVLSRGPDELHVVADPSLASADAHVTAHILAAMVQKLGGADLVICGEGAGDDYAQQVGPRIAQLLGWPVLSYVSETRVDGDRVTVCRAVEEGNEVVECRLPAVITVLGDSNTPRIAMMKQILGVAKKPFTVHPLASLGLPTGQTTPRVTNVRVKGNVQERRRVLIEGEPAKAAAEAVRLLAREGVL